VNHEIKAMKSPLLLLTVLGVCLPAVAQDEPLVVAPVQGRQLRFNWPRTGDVYVRDIRSVTLPAGRSRLQLQGLNKTIGDSASFAATLKLSPPTRLIKSLPTPTSRTSAPAPKTDRVTFFDSFIGQRVSLLQETRTGEKTVTGILRLTDGRYSLETPTGILYNPTGQWIFPGTVELTTNEPAKEGAAPVRNDLPNSFDPIWLLEGNGRTEVEADYIVKNLSWTPRYTGFLSADRKSVQMQGSILLSTPDDFDFRGAAFKLVDAEGVVPLADTTELRAGTTAVGFWNGVFNITQALSFFNGDWAKNIGSENGYALVQRTYKTVENGGAFLPRGPLTLWQQNEDGTTQPSNFDNFGTTQAASPLILPLADQTTESSVLRVVTSNKLLNPQTREVIINWKVRGNQEGAPLSITDSLPPDASIKESSLKPVENNGRTLRFEVVGNADFTYRFQIPNG
jgi:hypothetical protein